MSSENQAQEHAHHVMPLKIYFGIFGALIVLTGLTVAVSYMNLGVFSIYAAMMVALVKGGLVVGYFMHLKFDTKFHQLIFFGSLFFMVVFFVFTFIDISNRARIVPEQGNYALSRDRIAKAKAILLKKRQDAAEKSAKALTRKVTPQEFAKAKQTYTARCLSCHGAKGRGLGPAGVMLKPRPRDYTDAAWQKRVKNREIAKSILKGGMSMGLSPTMPAHPDLKPEITGLVAYIRSFGGIDMVEKAAPAKTQPVKADKAAPAKTQPVKADKAAKAQPVKADKAPAKAETKAPAKAETKAPAKAETKAPAKAETKAPAKNDTKAAPKKDQPKKDQPKKVK